MKRKTLVQAALIGAICLAWLGLPIPLPRVSAAAADLPVYTDALSTGWDDKSWDTDRDGHQ